MDLEAIRALLAVAEQRSLGAAARELGITQQAVSLRIRALERDLGCDLVVRGARGSSLTPTGEVVAGWGRPAVQAADRFDVAAAAFRAGRIHRLSIIASLTIAEHLLPLWLPRAFPEGRTGVSLVAANSAAVIEAVRAGDHDLGFIETPDIPADLSSVAVATDELWVVVAPGHPWAAQPAISCEVVSKTPLAIREAGSGTRRALEQALASVGLAMTPPIGVFATSSAIRAAAASGFAPGVLSALAVREDVAAGRLHRVKLDKARVIRPFTAIWRGREPSPAARRLLESIAAG